MRTANALSVIRLTRDYGEQATNRSAYAKPMARQAATRISRKGTKTRTRTQSGNSRKKAQKAQKQTVEQPAEIAAKEHKERKKLPRMDTNKREEKNSRESTRGTEVKACPELLDELETGKHLARRRGERLRFEKHFSALTVSDEEIQRLARIFDDARAGSNRVNRLTLHLHSARTAVHSASASSFCIKFSKFSLTVPDPFYFMYDVFGSGMAAGCKDARCGLLVEPGFYGRVISTN